MRPKKVILCLDSDEDDLGILAFLLETSGYRAVKSSCVSEAVNVLMRTPVELMIVSATIQIDDAITAVRILKGICPHTPLILLCHRGDLGDKFHLADMAISRSCSSAELLERIKIMSGRKRGPRKGLHRYPMPPAIDAVSPVVDRAKA